MARPPLGYLGRYTTSVSEGGAAATNTAMKACRRRCVTNRGVKLDILDAPWQAELGEPLEVMSFDGLVNAATEHNRAFFDKLGLPSG